MKIRYEGCPPEPDVLAKMTTGHRALIAAKIVTESRERQMATSRIKNAWIARARLSCQPGPRKACLVCGSFQDFAQAHHVYPVAMQLNDGRRHVDHETEWLCPNHHAVVHAMISVALGTGEVRPSYLGPDERYACLRLVHRALSKRTAA